LNPLVNGSAIRAATMLPRAGTSIIRHGWNSHLSTKSGAGNSGDFCGIRIGGYVG
jgi:hypothetical protein